LLVVPAQYAGASLEQRRMKLSREFKDEEQARARERALQAGYRAWLNCKGDGTWQLYWFEQFN
jgi:hypothetical protein